MQNQVFVIDSDKQPLTPTSPAQARKLLDSGKAAVFRHYPFTIALKRKVEEAKPAELQLKIDPGSKTTGLAILNGALVIWAAELTHRGQQIKNDLESRRAIRSGRRNRKTRYRKPRFLNRVRPEGWLAPSLNHRVETVMTWVYRLSRYSPIKSVAQELVRFDLQKMQNPEISGVEYQQGELQGYEVREYLLEKWGRQCAYCGAKDTPLEVEHIHPKSKGGSNRISNLSMACHDCNQTKGNSDIRDFLSQKPSVLARILKQAKAPLKDAAAVNSTRWALFNMLKATGMNVSTGSGGRTKFNRCSQDIPKHHWTDAACVGDTPQLSFKTAQPLLIRATGHGNRQMCGTDKFGFPKRHRTNQKVHFGFQTGDMIRADVPKGKKAGIHTGRVLCRKTGSFDISVHGGRVAGINHKYCKPIHKADGYQYSHCGF
ncbi:MAG: HNH endonuclease [Synechococcales cyanobacterium RM1_1_8]|nr:HNH endonuclease [Synechococcales cyanobacterium RM1_1_8]